MKQLSRNVKLIFMISIVITIASMSYLSYSKSAFKLTNVPENSLNETQKCLTTQVSNGSNYLLKCEKKPIRLAEERLPKTGLVSLPGSGNTWTRHLLQQVSGIGTSSVYCTKYLTHQGFPFECEGPSDKVLVVKTHNYDRNSLKLFERIIFIIRNPFNAILAAFNRVLTKNETGHADAESFFKGAWSWFVDTKLKDWKNLSHLWLLNFTGPVHLLFYEDLQDYLFCELQSVFKFLEYSVNTNTLECAVKNSEGNHHRQKRILRNSGRPVLTLKDIYTEKMIAKINEVSAEVRALLQTFYKRTWNYHMLQDKVL